MADDDAFGPAWASLDPVEGEEVWRTGLSAKEPRDLDALVAALASAWGLKLAPFDVGTFATVDRVVLAGPSAILAAIRGFVGRSDLDWAEQVTVVATPAGHRQLALLSTAILNGTKPARIVTHGQASALVGRVVVSPDAAAEDAAAARASTS